jgi:transposase
MRPITIEVREIIVAAKERGEKPATIALWAKCSVGSVYKICRLAKENELTPKPFPGRQSILTAEQLVEIKEAVEAENDITLEELIEKLKLPIKKSRLSLVLIRMGFSLKKRLFIRKNSYEKM